MYLGEDIRQPEDGHKVIPQFVLAYIVTPAQGITQQAVQDGEFMLK